MFSSLFYAVFIRSRLEMGMVFLQRENRVPRSREMTVEMGGGLGLEFCKLPGLFTSEEVSEGGIFMLVAEM